MNQPDVTIIIPCFNESDVIVRFLRSLERELLTIPSRFLIRVVNDGSTDNTVAALAGCTFCSVDIAIDVVNLKENRGHQAAILAGIRRTVAESDSRIIVMDGDGEDDPAVIKELVVRDTDIIHVVRSSRNEALWFRTCYMLYRGLFFLATGRNMRYGNYCCLSGRMARRVAETGFVHFASAVTKLQAKHSYVPAAKQPRLGGVSRMGFRAHYKHAISSIAEFGTSAAHRLLGLAVFLLVLAGLVSVFSLVFFLLLVVSSGAFFIFFINALRISSSSTAAYVLTTERQVMTPIHAKEAA